MKMAGSKETCWNNKAFDGIPPDHDIGEIVGFIFRDWFERIQQDPNDYELNADELKALRNLAENIHRGNYQPVEYRDQQQVDFLELMTEPHWVITEVMEILDICPDTLTTWRREGRFKFALHPSGRWTMPHSEVLRLAREYKPNYFRRNPDRGIKFTIGKNQDRTAMDESRGTTQRPKQPNQVECEQVACE